ncbi:saccharopine dehydrogenase NADP-binding domain-containing protein [Micromonospora sp. CPCC 206061]|uniref:saccharopine dehydrogenase NADP-binding domain-containing protein n=1 Tax=Micromonospora sp. CPCC 206061 TaxID=3122410 RepID=UPI002FF23CB0
MIGVVGATGAVGAAAVRQLAAWGYPVRAGGRSRVRLERLAAAAGPELAVRPVDVEDPAGLADFCAGCQAVVNCAGPSVVVLDRVARAAAAAGADYVDAAGDERLATMLRAAPASAPGACVLSAGMTPGLSGLLPRYLAGEGFDQVHRLIAHHGGRDRFTPAGAADYLAEVDGGGGEPGGVWRDGAVLPRALAAEAGARLPFFPEPAAVRPYLAPETVRLARDLRLAEARWYNVFAGERTLDALERARSLADPARAVAELVRAAELDVFGRAPYQIFVLELAGAQGGAPVTRTLVVRGGEASTLTGVTAAMAAAAVVAGECPPGVHYAAEVLDAAAAVRRLHKSEALAAFAVLVGPAAGALDAEDGAL